MPIIRQEFRPLMTDESSLEYRKILIANGTIIPQENQKFDVLLKMWRDKLISKGFLKPIFVKRFH
jgi:hypothetical protein